MLFCLVLAAMQPRRVLDSFSGAGSRPLWSYLHTGTLLRLISFICHSYENTRDVGVFFPFWNAPSLRCLASSPNSLSPLFSNSWALLCTLSFALFCTHEKLNPFIFKRFRTLLQKHPAGVSPFLRPSQSQRSLASAILSLPEEPHCWKSPRVSC